MKVQELDVFKLAHKLALLVYRVTERFPASERFGVVSQMRRAAASVPSNLMEGAHRIGTKEFKYFVSIARGSCGEMKYFLMLAQGLDYLNRKDFDELLDGYERIAAMLTKLHAAL